MRIKTAFPLALLALSMGGCDRTGAFGDVSSIVAAMDPTLWDAVEEDVYASLEPTIFTVREERTFTVTYQDPMAPQWDRLRRFKQMLLVGTRSDPWIAEVLERVDDAETLTAPRILQVRDVWARAQLVTVVLLPEENAADALRDQLPALGDVYDRQFRDLAISRMFISGRDSALAETLAEEAGFSLLLPDVYYWDRRDSVFVFRNDNPDPSELIRQVAVTWRTPIPDELDGEELLVWREEVAAANYSEPQQVELANVEAGPFLFGQWSAYQVQAVWQNTPAADWPAGGPFILRAIACPEQDRLYMVDAWLYAPGKEKYEYMVQLETILDSFRCQG